MTAGILAVMWLVGLQQKTENILLVVPVIITAATAIGTALWLSVKIIKGLWRGGARRMTAAGEHGSSPRRSSTSGPLR